MIETLLFLWVFTIVLLGVFAIGRVIKDFKNNHDIMG